MVHVGVSGVASEITLEQQAHNDGYSRHDVEGCLPHEQVCVSDTCADVIVSGISMDHICNKVNQSGVKTLTVVSHDPGR